MNSLPKSTALPNGLSESRCYDDASHLTTVVTSKGGASTACTPNGTISRFDYGYDANGNRQSQLEARTSTAIQTLQAAEQTTYGYDLLDRLVAVAYPDGTRAATRSTPSATASARSRVRRLLPPTSLPMRICRWARTRPPRA